MSAINRISLIVAISLSLMLTACESAPSTSDNDLQHVDYRVLNEWLAEQTEKKPIVIVDLRPPARYEVGHIPGAINIPQGELNSFDQRFVKASKIIFYHESFTGLYADIAAKKLISEGVSQAYSYGGGWIDWKKRSSGQE